ncbi:type II toxin-antitoxin system HicA family toxin [Burkholderia sola]|uniref:type II toxin-antitoxin system HicA family toxin n=1 Tax=Burkholderia TaxID=32008 RepID=UPI001AE4A197|nr:type II toxin-antitoxin system HicA family toxin [Burkholderia sp. AcTa6-5]MBP0714225.1 type II toxin-antitoxin system HicA family toxin [Burkholderia sp. AcTa6-5]
MPNARDLARGHKQLLPLIEYALSEGWTVSRTHGGHLRFVKPGLPPIYTSSTGSDHRGCRNARAMLKRAQRQVSSEHDGEGGTRHG